MAHPDTVLDFQQLPITSIVLPDGWRGTADPPDASEPMLQLPILVIPSDNGYRVVDGCKRLAYVRSSGMTTCCCGILPPSLDETGEILLRIRLNRYRTMPLSEKYYYVNRLLKKNEVSAYEEAGACIFTDRKERDALEKLIVCSQPVIDAVCSGSVSLPFAIDINRLDGADQTALLALFKQYPFSHQMQKELIDWLPELAFREKNTISTILSSSWVQEIITQDNLNGPQKIDKLRQTIYNRRFPTIAKAKKNWVAHAAAINPDPSSIIFKPSDAFEKNRLEIKITITTAKQASTIFSQLSTFVEDTWDKLIYPVQ